ncbi:hypothetical protein SteCoe_23900 [Stentor coeruleus]|uniref:non-specific serine/threonine protein kinase n=1 Tax=Stentor coeruleus TaxID=5963 RepID=A0A1R2BIS2_9CILI|nr:hypothetical protein SteCoe_27183 [Stentor coeruleus]OMJ76672.1 hypothetical protein SteCoe_23900 [Stentor coeruleus]
MGICCSNTSIKRVIDNDTARKTLKITAQTFVKESTQQLLEVYKVGNIIGTGTYGEVRLVTHKETNQQRAMKVFRKNTSKIQKEKIRNEIGILKNLDHPNIIRMFEYFEDTHKIYLIMEKCEGGELYEYILKQNSFSEFEAANIIKQLLSALAYLHENKIVHRDIKPENILFEETHLSPNIKLIDFGIATKFFPGSFFKEPVGTVYYISPEVISEKYTEKCDMWSCGILAYMILCGEVPFDGNSDIEIIKSIQTKNISFNQAIWLQNSIESRDFILKLLCPENIRMTALQALNHPWITNIEIPSPCKEAYTSTLTALKTFNNNNKLKEAIRTFIVTQCTTITETKELKKIFKAIDKNSDGKISKNELSLYYSRFFNSEKSDEEVSEIMAKLDKGNTGFINYTEFIKACVSDSIVLKKENLKAAFNKFDMQRSGKISTKEIKAILQDEEIYEENVWNGIMKECDRNNDGVVDFEEFCDLFFRENKG